ncbi:MAG: hypothetical protein MK213_06565, partial [Planctomycetes bacterium]|nr:hypothetical protein [Planctomycetota bacterium]
MMGFLGGCLMMICAWLTGRACMPSRKTVERSLYEESTVSLMLGLAVFQVGGMTALFFGATLSLPLCLSFALIGGFLGARQVRQDSFTSAAACPFSKGQKVLVGLLGLGSVALTLAWPLNEFDPILHFALKGRLLHGGTHLNSDAFHAVTGEFGRIMTHPNYPLGLPILEAWSAHFGGGWSDRWIQLPLAFWSLCLPGAVAFGLRGFSAGAARRGALIAACTPILYVFEFLHKGLEDFGQAGLGAEKMLGGRGDLPVAAFFGLACALFLRAHIQNKKHLAVLAGLSLAGAILSKNEGLALTGVFALAAAICLTLQRFRQAILPGIALALTFLCTLPWLVQRASLPAIDENYTQAVSLENALHFIQEDETADRAPINPKRYGAEWSDSSHWRPARLARYFGGEAVDWLTWGLLWVLAALASFQAIRDPLGRWLVLVVA